MNEPEEMIGKFVTANLAGLKDPRQGWVIEGPLYKIQRETGVIHICEGPLSEVDNPPFHNPYKRYKMSLTDGCWNCKHSVEFPEHPNCQSCMDRFDGWEKSKRNDHKKTPESVA